MKNTLAHIKFEAQIDYIHKRFNEAADYQEWREKNITFYQRLVEDLTCLLVKDAVYDRASETYRFIFEAAFAEDLCIKLPWNVFTTCTPSIIQGAEAYFERGKRAAELQSKKGDGESEY